MTPLEHLKEEIEKIGYSTVRQDYVFSDVFSASGKSRTAKIAAFTQTPPSYRNAALAVVQADGRRAIDIVTEYRGLGAPLLFVVEDESVTVWQVRSKQPPIPITSAAQDALSSLFSEHHEAWSPRSIQAAKSLAQFDQQYQLSFVDLGLLPAIEGEIHTKLDSLLNRALAEAIDTRSDKVRMDEPALFRAIFRFLAAKILHDRGHSLAGTWDPQRVDTILAAISGYYQLPSLLIPENSVSHHILGAVWKQIYSGITFQNISADDLAFVYENTLVTPEVRKKFGTHSTPRSVAEYVVRCLDLHNYPPEQLRVYEPFAGAGIFLISALRYLRERLPLDWSDAQRHNFLVHRISGDEIDTFACEAAMLSLILADYPNRNGWKVRNTNLFEDGILQARMRANNVILCNPPFEDFGSIDRQRYQIAQNRPSAPIAVLNAALDAHPLALGFVLPRPLLIEKQYAAERKRIETLYASVDLIELPDRTFRISKTETALLIARDPRPPAAPFIRLRSTEVTDRDRKKFLETGETTVTREIVRPVSETPKGDLWIPPLKSLWEYLRSYPRLGQKFDIHRGVEWNYEQDLAWSSTRKPGFRRGLHSGRGAQQFLLAGPTWLDCRENSLRGGAINWPWNKPKLIANAGRLSRGRWRLAAAWDESGLVCSQQFFGLWPKTQMTKRDFLAFAAVLNGPIANLFVSVQSPQKGIRISALKEVPIISSFSERLCSLVEAYTRQLETEARQLLVRPDAGLDRLLAQIDAAVLQSYDLPPRMERELLEFFRSETRPVGHVWEHWLPENFKPFIPLHEYISEQYQRATEPWVQRIFEPLPPEEVAALRDYLD